MLQHQCPNFNVSTPFPPSKPLFRQKPQKPPTAKNSRDRRERDRTAKNPQKLPPKISCERSQHDNHKKNPTYIFSTEHPKFSMAEIISSELKLSGMVTKIFVWMRCFSLMHILTWLMKSQVIWSSIDSISFTLQIP